MDAAMLWATLLIRFICQMPHPGRYDHAMYSTGVIPHTIILVIPFVWILAHMTCIKIHIITKKLISWEALPALTLLGQCARNARFCETFSVRRSFGCRPPLALWRLDNKIPEFIACVSNHDWSSLSSWGKLGLESEPEASFVGDIWGYPEINVGKSISYLCTLSLHFVC